jgi:hypothetical protein
MSRGVLTDEVKNKAKGFFQQEDFTAQELRLLPYIQYQLMNSQKINPANINPQERHILQKWRDAGHLTFGMSELTVTREFWDFMNDVLWDTYVESQYE